MNACGIKNVQEKPLSRGARVLLVFGVSLAMLSFYIFSLCAILLLAAWILAELGLLLALARFGAARLMVPFLEKHVLVLGLLVKSFRLQKGVEFQIPLRRDDAPALHAMLAGLCQRLQLAFPDEISLQMGDGAWVRLKGLGSGAGKTTLGVGYDLLAGLSLAEMEAVLAHEMTHAKLIHRGYRNWVWGVQSRVRNLAVALWTEVNTARRTKRSSSVAQALFAVVDRLVRISTRLIATYSRQDEFAADRGAAGLCGAGVMKSALSRLEALHRITSRLPWNERVAQLQQGWDDPGPYPATFSMINWVLAIAGTVILQRLRHNADGIVGYIGCFIVAGVLPFLISRPFAPQWRLRVCLIAAVIISALAVFGQVKLNARTAPVDPNAPASPSADTSTAPASAGP